MGQKWILKSKTVIGGVLMLIPILASLLGVQPPSADDLASAQASAGQILDGIATLGGIAMVIWGRFTATTQVTLLPPKA